MTEELGLEIAIEGFRTFLRQMGQADDAIDGTGKKWGGLGTAAGKASTSLTNAGGVLAGAVVAGAVAAAAALASVVVVIAKVAVDSTKLAIDFQSQMAVLGIAASAAGTSFDELHDAALKVGADTTLVGVSATGAADALTGLYKAGLTTTEIFGDLDGYMEDTIELSGALRAAIDLAAASELDMVQASDLAAIALAAFGAELETEEERASFINEAMNNMVMAADASVAEVSGLAEALKLVGPTASAAGLSIQDTNNALAILSTRGIQGSMAGTALDGMLRSLRDPADQAAEKLEELGIEVFDLGTGEMLPLVDIIKQFESALGDATEAEKAAAIGTIFTAQGQRAMNTLMTEGVKGWDDMAAATKKAAGTQVVAAAKAATFAGKMEALDGTVETLKIGIGEAFLPVATEMATWFATMVDEHGPKLQAVFETIGAFLQENLPIAIERLAAFWNDTLLPAFIAVGAYIQETVLPALGELAVAFGVVMDKVADLWAVMEPYIVAAAEWIANHVQLKDVLIGLGIVLATAIIPALVSVLASVLAIAAPIVAVIVAVALLRTAWESDFLGIRTAITDFWENSVKPAFEAIKEWLAVQIPLAIEVAKAYWEGTLKPAMETVWAFIQGNVIPIFETVVNWLKVNIPVAIQAASDFWENTLKPALETVWAFIQDNVIPIIETVVEWLQVNIPVAIQMAADFWENTLKPALEAVWLFIQDNVIPIIESVVEWLQVNIPAALEIARQYWEEVLLPALDIVWKFVQDNLLPLFEALKEFFNVALTVALTALQGLWENVLLPALTTVWEFIKDKLQPIFEALEEFWTETLKPAIEILADLFSKTLKEAWDTLVTAFTTAKTNILDPIKAVFDAIATAVQNVITWIKELTEKLKNIPVADMFVPGSPTPFEMGLRGIAETMEGLTRREIPRLAGALQMLRLPEQMASIRVEAAGLARGTVGVGAAGGAGGGGRSVVNETVNNFNLTTQSTTRPGALAMEFNAMSLATR